MKESLAANTTISHYRILSRLGAGGMGEVYLAEDTRLDRRVVLKLLPAELTQDADRLRRFEQEARAAGMLNHPNILIVHDIGAHEGSPYIISELLEGETLRARLSEGALPVCKAMDCAQQIARGLAAAHEKGITHRDLKPENLFLLRDGRVKILDFGLAKLKPQRLSVRVDTEAPTRMPQTEPGVVMGTAGYMSPEQVRGQEADHRPDIFSFGVILYEMLTRRGAFLHETTAETMTAILKEEPEEVTAVNRQVPPQLDRVVKTCLSKDPDERFQAAHDLKLQLQWIVEGGSRTQLLSPVTAQHKTRERVIWASAGFALAAIAAAIVFRVPLRGVRFAGRT